MKRQWLLPNSCHKTRDCWTSLRKSLTRKAKASESMMRMVLLSSMVSIVLQVKVAQAATQNQTEKIEKVNSGVVYPLSRRSKCSPESILRSTSKKKSARLITTTPNKKLSHKSMAANTNQKHPKMPKHHRGRCPPENTG